MMTRWPSGRLLTGGGVCLLLLAAAACRPPAEDATAPTGTSPYGEPQGAAPDHAAPPPGPGAAADGGPATGALHGAEPTSDGSSPDSGTSGAGPAPATPPKPPPAPPEVTFGDVETTGDADISGLDGALKKSEEALAQCIVDGGGMPADEVTVKMQFLVRASGKAEGVEILDAGGLDDASADCLQERYKHRRIGTPSTDPVGVTLEVHFKAAKGS